MLPLSNNGIRWLIDYLIICFLGYALNVVIKFIDA